MLNTKFKDINEKVQLFASKIDKNQDKILDNDEISEFINQVKFFAKDNNLSIKEAVKLISNYQIEELTADDLQTFMAFVDEESENIEESTVFVDNNGQKIVFIKYSDGKEETIFSDKTSRLIYVDKNESFNELDGCSVYNNLSSSLHNRGRCITNVDNRIGA